MESKGIDYVALCATVVLGILGSVAMYFGNDEVALVVAGAVAGYMSRYYQGEK